MRKKGIGDSQETLGVSHHTLVNNMAQELFQSVGVCSRPDIVDTVIETPHPKVRKSKEVNDYQ